MNYSNLFKKQTFMVVGAICLIMVVFIGISYAMYTKNLEGKNLVVKSGNLEITFTEGDTINGELLPLSDTDGKTNGSTYNFVINNTGTLKASYSIQLYTDKSVTGTAIPHQYIKLSYDGGNVMTLSELEKAKTGTTEADNVYIINRSTVDVGDANKQNHNLKIWISSEAPTDIIGNVISYKIKVVSEVDK